MGYDEGDIFGKDRGWARVYFIDGKESRSGVKCLVISESRMSEEKRAGGGLSRTHPFLREGVGEGFGSPWYRVFKREALRSGRDPQQAPERLIQRQLLLEWTLALRSSSAQSQRVRGKGHKISKELRRASEGGATG